MFNPELLECLSKMKILLVKTNGELCVEICNIKILFLWGTNKIKDIPLRLIVPFYYLFNLIEKTG